MPLPIAHGLVGASLVALIHPSAEIKNWKPLLWGFLLANSPDLDFAFAFLFGWKDFHRGISHSLVFAFLVGALIFVFLRGENWRIPLAYALAFLSHTLLDFAASREGAVRLLTPFDDGRYALGWFGFSELTRGFIISDMLRFSIIETLIFVPVFFILLYAKKVFMKIIPLSIPTPFYVGAVNIYLVKEDPLTLVDVGPKTEAAANALREKLRENGVRLEDIKRIVLTHAHEDHCGLAKQVREGGKNAEIYVHRWETGHLFGRLAHAEHKNLMLRAGVPETVFREMQSLYADVSLLTDTLTSGEFSELKDEMELEFASGVLKVLHTPGHTPGSCSFFREANRTLIAGDSVLKRVTPNPILSPDPIDSNKRFKSLAEYLVSLARIRLLAPTLIYGGHGEPIDDYEEIFHRYIRSIDERQKNVISLVSNDGVTAFDVARKLFPDAIGKDVHRFLAISEAVAHLDYAEAERKIAVELKDGVEFYRKV